jgi:hypothetical protein
MSPSKSKSSKNTNKKNSNGSKTAKKSSNNQNSTKSRTQRSGITPSMRGANEKKMSVQWGQDSVTIMGQDFINVLQFVPESSTTGVVYTGQSRNFSGAVLACQMVNPWRIPGSRLTQFANLFQRFKFEGFSIRYIPAVPATTAGQIIMAFDTDPTFAPIGSAQSVINTMMAHQNRKLFHVFDDMTMSLPKTSNREYYCDALGQDLRLNNQAVWWAVLVSKVVTSTGNSWQANVGSFVVEWKCRFHLSRIAQVQNTVIYDSVTMAFHAGSTDTDYSLNFISGAAPTTQAFVIIPQIVVGLTRLTAGVVYYMGGTNADSSGNLLYTIYGTLRGAQQSIANDIIPVEVITGAAATTLTFLWYPVGPPVGSRSGISNALYISGSTLASDLGIVLVSLQFPSRYAQATGYELEFCGVASTGPAYSSAEDPTLVVHQTSSGTYHTLTVGTRCEYHSTSCEAFLNPLPGWDDAMFTTAFGHSPSVVPTVGVLTVNGGLLCRVLNITGNSAVMTFKVMSETHKTDVDFMAQIDTTNSALNAIANGTNPGQTLTVTTNTLKRLKFTGGEQNIDDDTGDVSDEFERITLGNEVRRDQVVPTGTNMGTERKMEYPGGSDVQTRARLHGFGPR